MFKRIYAGLGEDLFWLTQALVKLSDSLRFNPEAWIVGTMFSGVIIIFVYRMFGWYWLLNLIPGGKRTDAVLQSYYVNHASHRCSFAGGTGFVGRDFVKLLRKRIALVREAVDSGKSLCDAYAMIPVFSLMFVKMFAFGESSRHLTLKFCANRLKQS